MHAAVTSRKPRVLLLRHHHATAAGGAAAAAEHRAHRVSHLNWLPDRRELDLPLAIQSTPGETCVIFRLVVVTAIIIAAVVYHSPLVLCQVVIRIGVTMTNTVIANVSLNLKVNGDISVLVGVRVVVLPLVRAELYRRAENYKFFAQT